MLLRHNSNLKAWYKFFCNTHDSILGEDSFAMDMVGFWKLVKDLKVTDSFVTLAALDRLFYLGKKN
jgi:hypothetical protein